MAAVETHGTRNTRGSCGKESTRSELLLSTKFEDFGKRGIGMSQSALFQEIFVFIKMPKQNKVLESENR